jgi:hypothetical protein
MSSITDKPINKKGEDLLKVENISSVTIRFMSNSNFYTLY